MSTAAPIVELRDAERTYEGPPAVAALRRCDVRIEAGEHVAIMGRSGSGKSTLLNVLGLLDSLTGGSYAFDGIQTADLGDRDRTALRGRRIAFVFQSFHLVDYRSCIENLELAMLYARVPRRERRRRAQAALARVGLSERAETLPSTLSGGERQRVALARALVTGAGLLLCDEPTGNLDSVTSASILDLLDELHAQGLTIVVVTHDPAVADRADRLVTIDDGVVTDHAPRRPAPR